MRNRCAHPPTPRVCYERYVQVFDRSTPFAPVVLSAVAVGGAVGASGRWLVGWMFGELGAGHQPGTWPWATLTVNILGCVLIGLAARFVAPGTTVWAFVVTGVLGGFTTFSALAVELNDLADADRMPIAVLYAAVTLAAGIGATAVADVRRGRR